MDKNAQFMSVIMKRLIDLADSLGDDTLKSKLREVATDIGRWLEFGDFIDATRLAEIMTDWDKEKIKVFLEEYLIPTMKKVSEMRNS